MKFTIIRSSTMEYSTIEINTLEELLQLVDREQDISLVKCTSTRDVTIYIGDEEE